MTSINQRLALIEELRRFPNLTDDENSLLNIGEKNYQHLMQAQTLEEKAEAAAIHDEIGHRLHRLKRKIAGSNVRVFNRRKMHPPKPVLAQTRVAI